MKNKWNAVAFLFVGALALAIVLFGAVVRELFDTRRELEQTREELKFTYQRLVYTQDQLNEENQEFLSRLIENLQKAAYDIDRVIVHDGNSYVSNIPMMRGQDSNFYQPNLLTGTWNDKRWNLETSAGDYIDISDEIVPGKLIANVRRYYPEEDRFSEFQTVLADK